MSHDSLVQRALLSSNFKLLFSSLSLCPDFDVPSPSLSLPTRVFLLFLFLFICLGKVEKGFKPHQKGRTIFISICLVTTYYERTLILNYVSVFRLIFLIYIIYTHVTTGIFSYSYTCSIVFVFILVLECADDILLYISGCKFQHFIVYKWV